MVARTHPGESNSSFAMEGFLKLLFSSDPVACHLRQQFSWLIVPMMNVDGVICGFYRPNLLGDDLNRIWITPDSKSHPEAKTILDLISELRRTRTITFFLDFHGHSTACNSFVYGYINEGNSDLFNTERYFPYLLSKNSSFFSYDMCKFDKQSSYEGTMRVVFRRRFLILFAYTLEMSFGGCDFGLKGGNQFTPHDFRSIGESTLKTIEDLFFSSDSQIAAFQQHLNSLHGYFLY